MDDRADRLKFRCPKCGRPVERRTRWFPFCSRRCRLVDLGDWLSERYRIPGEPAPADEGDEAR
ncbi:MAG: DNA gyrase inhibitor YacG [Zetaproteobacteria bacterium]|nr:MAG: DNA gyrase inhibitor YacG [Zetaproteobacteria bacterium]